VSKASPQLRTLQSEIAAIQHLAHIESALERSAEHPSADSKPSSEKKYPDGRSMFSHVLG
jgi:hypothetical protein